MLVCILYSIFVNRKLSQYLFFRRRPWAEQFRLEAICSEFAKNAFPRFLVLSIPKRLRLIASHSSSVFTFLTSISNFLCLLPVCPFFSTLFIFPTRFMEQHWEQPLHLKTPLHHLISLFLAKIFRTLRFIDFHWERVSSLDE